MKRSHVLARELRGTVVIVLVAMMILWLFARLNDDRAEAKARIATADTTTTTTTIAETTTTTIVDNNQRLCSLSAAFRTDLANLQIVLVSPSGAPVNGSNALPIDIGLHPDGDIPDAGTPADEAPEPTAQPAPAIVNPDRIDPLESGLLGAPQKVALNFYGAAASLRLGLIDADFDAALAHLDDMVLIAEPLQWNLAEIAESDLADRWTALISRPNVSVDGTLDYIEEQCAIRIGSRFLYREKAPELPILEQVFVDGDVDPGQLPQPGGDGDGDG